MPDPVSASFLREWAQQQGYVPATDNPDGPETWVDPKTGAWRLKIKEAGKRPGLDPLSQMPRASARHVDGQYLDPVTGRLGTRAELGHIPVDLDK